MPRSVKYLFVCLLVLGTARCASGPLASTAASASEGAAPAGRAVVARKDVSHALRLHGTVEAQNAVAIVVPRILGQNINALVASGEGKNDLSALIRIVESVGARRSS